MHPETVNTFMRPAAAKTLPAPEFFVGRTAARFLRNCTCCHPADALFIPCFINHISCARRMGAGLFSYARISFALIPTDKEAV